MVQIEYRPPLKSEQQLRNDLGDIAAAYVLKSRRVADRIDGYIEHLRSEYRAACSAHRWDEAARISEHADRWIARLSRILFHRELVAGKAWVARQQHAGTCDKCGKRSKTLTDTGTEAYPYRMCGTCLHREQRRINTREMYGRGRRGY